MAVSIAYTYGLKKTKSITGRCRHSFWGTENVGNEGISNIRYLEELRVHLFSKG